MKMKTADRACPTLEKTRRWGSVLGRPGWDQLQERNERALVLGGGGVAGIAWTTGLLFGLSEQGVDLRDAELIVGTSAGAAVAAQLGSPLSLGELFQRQVDLALQTREITPDPH